MDNIEISTTSQQAISLFISVGIPALVLLVFAILSAMGLTEFAARVRVAARKTRKYFDEKDDLGIQTVHYLMEKFTKKEISEETLIGALNALFNQLEPPQEVNIGEATK